MIPAPLYDQINTLGFFAVPHRERDDQLEASFGLYGAVMFGAPEAVAIALRRLGEAFSRDAGGERIAPAVNWIAGRAFDLADQVEALVTAQKERVA